MVLLTNVMLVYLIYQDFQFALIVPLPVSLISSLFGLFIESGEAYFYTKQSSNPRSGLIPFGRFFSGLMWPLLFAWDDVLLQSDELGKPWFWNMVVSSYTGWLIGIVLARYRVIRKESHATEEDEASGLTV